MEALTRLVTDSLARHGFDRPIDPRRLQWSRWFRCDSPHSLLIVPSKPGIFAIAEEIVELGPGKPLGSSNTHAGTDPQACPEQSRRGSPLGTAALQPCDSLPAMNAASAAEVPRRMLAVLQFSEDDDMAFTLDRMFTRINPMRARLSSGSCFLRFVVIEDQDQRRNICAALNQWIINSAEKATGIPSDFSTSLELTTARVGRTLLSDSAVSTSKPGEAMPQKPEISAALDIGSAKNLHCPHPLPSGF